MRIVKSTVKPSINSFRQRLSLFLALYLFCSIEFVEMSDVKGKRNEQKGQVGQSRKFKLQKYS